jgi:hypothetical protein
MDIRANQMKYRDFHRFSNGKPHLTIQAGFSVNAGFSSMSKKPDNLHLQYNLGGVIGTRSEKV